MVRKKSEKYRPTQKSISLGGKLKKYFPLMQFSQQENKKIKRLPYSIKVLLESSLRNYDDYAVTKKHIDALINYSAKSTKK